MKLELLDAYHIRVHLCSSIIVFAPLAITVFFCFESMSSLISSTIFIAVLLAFTNYLPILQRQIYQKKLPFKNYAAQFLMPDDDTLNPISKERYYKILAKIDPTFSIFESSENSDMLYPYCESAVRYLREKSREVPLLLEENINYGFYRALIANKAIGIIFCVTSGILAAAYSLLCFESFSQIPINNYIAFSADIVLLLFWFLGVNKNVLDSIAKQYAKALLSTIDLLKSW